MKCLLVFDRAGGSDWAGVLNIPVGPWTQEVAFCRRTAAQGLSGGPRMPAGCQHASLTVISSMPGLAWCMQLQCTAPALDDITRPDEPLLPVCCAGGVNVHSGWGQGQ